MLAGRKLLLADDSITIQKIVALTFADEGIEVLAVSNGADAIDKLEEFWPDVVLADVYMPKMTGLQVCQYIRLNEQLKDIPVMLLVGSFEPFDEAEARRVGADDILTKPFQSIRTLVEKVGALLGRETANDDLEKASLQLEESAAEAQGVAEFGGAQTVTEIDSARTLDDARTLDGAPTVDGTETLEFPDPELAHVPDEPMDTGKLTLTTADTRPLSPEMRTHLQQQSNEDRITETAGKEEKMETYLAGEAGPDRSEGFGEVLLDLGDFETEPLISSDDIILDIDFDPPASELLYSAPAADWQSAVNVEAPAVSAVVIEDSVAWVEETEEVAEWEGDIQTSAPEFTEPTSVREEAVISDLPADEFAAEAAAFSVAAPPPVQEFRAAQPLTDSELIQPPSLTAEATAPAAGQITLEQLSPEAIDAIARRAVELLSVRVVQEIAWEVVPQLAELLIKQKLEESN